MAGRIQAHLRNTFLAGVFAAIPVAATAFILWYVASATRIITLKALGKDIPFVGVALALAGIYLLGLAVTSLLGRYLLRLLDWILMRMPLLKPVYQSWKQVALTPGEGIFARVVLVSDESGRMSLLGFTSGRPTTPDGDTLPVFIPAAPNPTSGRLCLVKRADCRFVAVSTEEAFKMILSSGCYVPEGLAEAAATAR